MPETKPTLRREQIAGMNIHYIMWSLDYFFGYATAPGL